jgi:hypothetical protein
VVGMPENTGFITFSSIGIILISWCYFTWNSNFPLFSLENDDYHKKFKKIIVYGLVLLYTVINNYSKIMPIENKETFELISNTVVIVILAVDRILNQLPLERAAEAKKKSSK